MELIATPRIEFLRGITAEITHNYGRGRVIVAVDGIEGSGTREFADGLAETFREAGYDTFRASINDFHNPRERRRRLGEDSPQGFYEDSYDYRTFRRVLIDPFRMAGSAGFQTAAFDVRRDDNRQSRWLTSGKDAVLIVDGVFLNRDELRGIWNYSLYLEVPWASAYARLAAEFGVEADADAASNSRYRRGQELYLLDAFPRGRANAIVDNTNAEKPTRVFADSC
jgi:uridine kinase